MAQLSIQQKKALEMIKKIEEHFGSRWFTQAELQGITMHTIDALVNRGHLETKQVEKVNYYKYFIVVDIN